MEPTMSRSAMTWRFLVIFLIMLFLVKMPAVRFMINLQNCRTQFEYEHTFVMMLWLLGFINGYTAIFYMSFVKGYFYPNPGVHEIYKDYNTFRNDLCGAAGCNQDVIILLTFLLIVKTLLVKCIKKVFFPIMRQLFVKKKDTKTEAKTQLEADVALGKLTEMTILLEYAEIVSRLSIVLFFTAVFPFVPHLVYLCNYFEKKVDAQMYVTSRRRPIPRKVSGLGVWFSIIYFVVTVGVLINALTSILTKDFILTTYHKHFYRTLDDFIATRFSKFAISDYKTEKIKHQVENLTYCLYFSPYRYPHEHPKKYQKMPQRFHQLVFGACFIVIYQHIVFLLTRLIAQLIPNLSADVKEHIYHLIAQEKKLIRKHRNLEYMKKRQSRISDKAPPILKLRS
ncbi:hypothetical protein HHI36_012876 [Cryptolaemus montrouzieri]|uniref:Anoctamin n=1 Tax=Cryptolaemus montrouzieri TaxID=559131 RepID=A0ABD2NFQ7_9CUCU